MSNALLFLVSTLFELYLFVLAIRLLLAFARINYFHPITQFIIRLTQPIVAPVRRFIPNYRNLESATLTWLFLIEIIKLSVLSALVGVIPPIHFLLLFAVSATIRILLQTLFYAILIQALLSWLNPGATPISDILEAITRPIMQPLRRLIPPIAGIDITPIPALIFLQFLTMLLP